MVHDSVQSTTNVRNGQGFRAIRITFLDRVNDCQMLFVDFFRAPPRECGKPSPHYQLDFVVEVLEDYVEFS